MELYAVAAQKNWHRLVLAAVNSLAGSVVATKAQQQAASSAVNVVTPSQQQSHASALKAAATFTAAATPVIQSSYNVTSITKGGTGQYTINFTTPFANSLYGCVVTVELTATFGTSGILGYVQNASRTTNSVIVQVINYVSGVPTVSDPQSTTVLCEGSQ
jgi:hypothetical protein